MREHEKACAALKSTQQASHRSIKNRHTPKHLAVMSVNRFFLHVVLLSTQALVGQGSPIEIKALQRRVDCDDVSKYTIEVSRVLQRKLPGSLTHSNSTSWAARSRDNRLRCIFADDSTREQYFAHMSEAMAISCDGFATVMTEDVNNIPQDGTWGRVEQPALKRTGNPGGQVDRVSQTFRLMRCCS